jgi:hypothetical protein
LYKVKNGNKIYTNHMPVLRNRLRL